MGSGKSSLGLQLAQALGRTFVDLDAAIVANAGRSIPEIFNQWGEARFRELETLALQSVGSDWVVALGGGTWLKADNRALMARSGKVIYLDWPLPVLLARVRQDANRPLAVNPLQSVSLFLKRKVYYQQSDCIVSFPACFHARPIQSGARLLEVLRAGILKEL